MKPGTLEWIEKAEDDREVATMVAAAGKAPDAICFHAQQCIEKMLKAALTEHGDQFPKTHDLAALAARLASLTPTYRPDPNDFDLLEPGAVEYRYPGARANLVDAREAVEIMERCRAALRAVLGLKP